MPEIGLWCLSTQKDESAGSAEVKLGEGNVRENRKKGKEDDAIAFNGSGF